MREFLTVGEYALAFDPLCEWIYEDDLTISPAYHERLRQLAEDMNAVKLVEDLREQIAQESWWRSLVGAAKDEMRTLL
ncbi:hypothetical protein GCM10010521_47890 [Streptomyces rameus]|uniref:Uncharacterized protein n=1 Tax=Streptomyces rameus TaxID=68261 RepID=A0ABP6NU59_9ACTN